MSWVLSMRVVEGLSAEAVAGRLEVVLFELSERVDCGLFRVGCWADGAMAWQIIH